MGRPPKKPIVWFDEFTYQANTWTRPRRVVVKVEWHMGELFPKVGFVVTNMSAKPKGVVHFYNGRGTAEQWIKEGKMALNWTRLSCRRFVANQVRLSLFVLAYNLGNFLRRLVLPRNIKHWSLRSLLVKLIKIGAKVVRHGRYRIFQMAEVAISVPRREAIIMKRWDSKWGISINYYKFHETIPKWVEACIPRYCCCSTLPPPLQVHLGRSCASIPFQNQAKGSVRE